MADNPTAQQRAAIENRGGKLLVSAAAGSGKTKVLVDRLMLYLTDPVQPANLDEFLIITYTKAAAAELRGKIAAKLTERIAQEPNNRHLQKQLQRLFLTQISTVHGFCANILREYAYRLDIPADFRMAEEAECRELQETVVQELLERAYETDDDRKTFAVFADTQGLGRDDRQIPGLVIKVYNSALCHADPEKWLADCVESFRGENIQDAGQTIWGRYLLEDLFSYLDCQIRIFRRCAEELGASPRMEKPAARFADVLAQMERLRGSESWDAVFRNKEILYGSLTFPKKDVDEDLRERTKAAWKACKEGLNKKLLSFTDDSRQVLEDLHQASDAAQGLIWLVRQFLAEYRKVKKSRRILDFGDLEHRALELLLDSSRSCPSAAAREIGSRYREILVDEYQDSNEVQDTIFSALTAQRQNCFMVGDVKQSIYQFRLAEPRIFLEKYEHYAPAEAAEPGQGRRILLSDNFRSGGEIIEGVNQVFQTCMSRRVGGLDYGEEEALREGIAHRPLPDPGVELHVLETTQDTGMEEAAFVAERIKTMLRSGTMVREGDSLRPVTPGDIVILLRSAKNTAQDYRQALENLGIRCSAGETDLLQSEEIMVLRALLQTVSNPRQDIPLLSVLASPVFGFTADDLAAFRSGRKKFSVYDALVQSDLPKAKGFLNTLEILRREARMNTLSELLERCFALTRLDSIYAAMPGGQVRKANLQQFYQMASAFEKTSLRSLDQFLEHLDAAAEKGLKSESGSTTGAVTIMTVHSSKGLEFPVVFLCGLARKFNTESRKEQILCDKELFLGMKAADTQKRVRYPTISHRAICAKMVQESTSEEMRILYVAMTRARDRLIMTWAGRKPEGILQELSRRYGFDRGDLLCREANSPGTWILLEALLHTEAGALHALAEQMNETRMGEFPWLIRVEQTGEPETGAVPQEQSRTPIPAGTEEALRQGLAFRYPHRAATMAPSKQTATGLKGRFRDAEAAEDTAEPKQVSRSWRTPTFRTPAADGKAYGNAMHCAMQYIRFENCADAPSVERELQRLTHEGFLTEAQREMVNSGQIAAFFATEPGRKLRSGAPCLREFKFSILDDGSKYGDGLEDEQVLLQGVVDCALLDEDGITVLDFKTDYVTADTVSRTVERYRLQVQTYSRALARIYGKPVKNSYLYFFRLGAFFEV